jgi:hypothetical protein
MQQSRLIDNLVTMPLGAGRGKPVWPLNGSGNFTVKSMYNKLVQVWVSRNFKYLWKAKVPPKVFFFCG